MKEEDWLPFLAMPPALLLCVVTSAVFVKYVLDLAPPPQPREIPWEERVEESDTSLPFVHIDPIVPEAMEVPEGWACEHTGWNTRSCSKIKPPEPPPVKGYTVDTGYGRPRFHPAECDLDDECPASTPKCTPQGRCVECYASWHCPGRLICPDYQCVEPEPPESEFHGY